ncbi:hypothetical protein N8H71_21120 [Pseudomonas koreensis]|uniref:hypothetical protein n=1 Tax=Pseudomonas koreensis TaxID=198620 RepID=UPI0021C73BE8|nr:hypothetical protein [Pseudomonas koreensis]MCU0074102.1 hypothetical protein [Pseudomonas koreensis]
MLKQTFAAALISIALASVAYADCPKATSITKQPDGSFVATTPEGKFPVDVDPESASQSEVQNLIFTAVRLKEKDQPAARAICQYEDGKKPSLLGASLVVKTGNPIQPSGSNWQGDDCSTKDGDVTKCAFK